MTNYAFTTGKKLPEAKDGDVFKDVNFARAKPHTKIFEGVKGLTFIGCNLINCDVPEDTIVKDCNGGHVEFCSNEHPKWAAKGIDVCGKDCKHKLGAAVIAAKVAEATAARLAEKAAAEAAEPAIEDTVSKYSDKVVK